MIAPSINNARQPLRKVKRSERDHRMPPLERLLNTISARIVQPRLMSAPRGFNIQAATATGMARMLPLCEVRKTDAKMATQSREDSTTILRGTPAGKSMRGKGKDL